MKAASLALILTSIACMGCSPDGTAPQANCARAANLAVWTSLNDLEASTTAAIDAMNQELAEKSRTAPTEDSWQTGIEQLARTGTLLQKHAASLASLDAERADPSLREFVNSSLNTYTEWGSELAEYSDAKRKLMEIKLAKQDLINAARAKYQPIIEENERQLREFRCGDADSDIGKVAACGVQRSVFEIALGEAKVNLGTREMYIEREFSPKIAASAANVATLENLQQAIQGRAAALAERQTTLAKKLTGKCGVIFPIPEQ